MGSCEVTFEANSNDNTLIEIQQATRRGILNERINIVVSSIN